MQTEYYYKQSLASHLPKQLGRATGHQIAESLDSLSCVKVVCSHVLHASNGDIPPHWQKRIDAIPTGAASMAVIIRTLALWRKWCQREASARLVQDFLYELTRTV